MIETPNENVKLSFDQMQAIDLTQKRLSILESEIAVCQKVLRGTKLESDRAIKEKAYQNELLDSVNKQLSEKQSILSKLDEEILVKSNEKAQLLSYVANNKDAQEKREMELKDKEDKVVALEVSSQESINDLKALQVQFQEEQKVFLNKVKALQEVLQIF